MIVYILSGYTLFVKKRQSVGAAAQEWLLRMKFGPETLTWAYYYRQVGIIEAGNFFFIWHQVNLKPIVALNYNIIFLLDRWVWHGQTLWSLYYFIRQCTRFPRWHGHTFLSVYRIITYLSPTDDTHTPEMSKRLWLQQYRLTQRDTYLAIHMCTSTHISCEFYIPNRIFPCSLYYIQTEIVDGPCTIIRPFLIY